ncbi:WLM domain-containing protein, partial [Mrakia frigida]|uniref:WLM domain-containing protein n=1 Tax=Mrakia frigida TaxID=29902 RepID=UPI003FCBFB1B
ELTHCHHMNHGPGFQKMLRGLEQEMAALHAKGYFGDGFWSSGSRLSDGFLQMSNPLHENKADYGEYLCGGAQKSKRPTSSKRNHRKNGLPLVSFASTSSGAQTAKKHKPGTRNLKAFDDKPSGNRLDGQRGQ